jgi:hypothetical protein
VIRVLDTVVAETKSGAGDDLQQKLVRRASGRQGLPLPLRESTDGMIWSSNVVDRDGQVENL